MNPACTLVTQVVNIHIFIMRKESYLTVMLLNDYANYVVILRALRTAGLFHFTPAGNILGCQGLFNSVVKKNSNESKCEGIKKDMRNRMFFS